MKLNTLCENRDYRRIYARGKAVVTPQIVIYIAKNRLRQTRVGITTGKKIGNAVMRNRARRIIRAAVYPLMPRIRPGTDLVLVARGRTPHLKSTDILAQLERQLKGAGVLL